MQLTNIANNGVVNSRVDRPSQTKIVIDGLLSQSISLHQSPSINLPQLMADRLFLLLLKYFHNFAFVLAVQNHRFSLSNCIFPAVVQQRSWINKINAESNFNPLEPQGTKDFQFFHHKVATQNLREGSLTNSSRNAAELRSTSFRSRS